MHTTTFPLNSINRTGTCWHYTNGAGLLGIVQKGSFWASSAGTALNDLSELEYGLRLFRDSLKTLSEERGLDEIVPLQVALSPLAMANSLRTVFVLSASRNGDSLNQWMHYGNSRGFAIELDMSLPLNTAVKHGLKEGLNRMSDVIPRAGWSDVDYLESSQTSRARELLLTALPGTPDSRSVGFMSLLALDAIARMKHPAFEAEEEVRSLFTSEPSTANFRESDGRLVMYVEAGRPPGICQGE